MYLKVSTRTMGQNINEKESMVLGQIVYQMKSIIIGTYCFERVNEFVCLGRCGKCNDP